MFKYIVSIQYVNTTVLAFLAKTHDIGNTDFIGMTADPIDAAEPEQTWVRLIDAIRQRLCEEDKIFLLGLKEGNPNWGTLLSHLFRSSPRSKGKIDKLYQMKLAERRTMTDRVRSFFSAADICIFESIYAHIFDNGYFMDIANLVHTPIGIYS